MLFKYVIKWCILIKTEMFKKLIYTIKMYSGNVYC